MLATTWPFIEFDDRQRPIISGTRFKVLMLAQEHLAYDWDAVQLHRQHPTLTLPQIHSALGYYYYEHQSDCDRQLEEGEQRLEELRSLLEAPELQARLRHRKTGA